MYGDLMWWEVAGSTLLPPSAMLCCDMLCGSTRGPGDEQWHHIRLCGLVQNRNVCMLGLLLQFCCP